MSSPATHTSSDCSAMPSKLSSCVIGIDVGGTNTDSVILQGDNVLAWHKTPTTSDIQDGVEKAIEEVVKKAKISPCHVGSVKIGTTVSSIFSSASISYLGFGRCFSGSVRDPENCSDLGRFTDEASESGDVERTGREGREGRDEKGREGPDHDLFLIPVFY